MSISHRLAAIATHNVFSDLFIIGPKLRKVEIPPKDLKMTLNATRPKVPVHVYIKNTTRDSQISLRFALRSLMFQINEFFNFSISYNQLVKQKFSKKFFKKM